MIKKLDFTDTKTLTQQCEVMADKIDEIIDAVNKIQSNISTVESEVNTITSKVSSGIDFSKVKCDSDRINITCGELRVNTDENFKTTISDLKIEHGKIGSLL